MRLLPAASLLIGPIISSATAETKDGESFSAAQAASTASTLTSSAKRGATEANRCCLTEKAALNTPRPRLA